MSLNSLDKSQIHSLFTITIITLQAAYLSGKFSLPLVQVPMHRNLRNIINIKLKIYVNL